MRAKLRHKLLTAIFLFVAMFTALMPAITVFAEPPSIDEQLAVSRWPNWVGLCGQVTPDDFGTNDTPAAGEAYILGDSVTGAAESEYATAFDDGGWTTSIRAKEDRQIATKPPSPSGLDQLKDDKDTIAKSKAIIIALGSSSVTKSQASNKSAVESVIKKVKAYNTSDAPIYWVNVMDAKHDSSSKRTNEAIKDGVGSDATFIDWYGTAKKKADLGSFKSGIIPTKPDDIKLLANLVYGAVNGGVANGGTASTGSSAEANGGVNFTAEMTIDTDGIGPSHGDAYHQGQTGWANGKLNADKTNYVALQTGWAGSRHLVQGDVFAVQYKGKTAYAVFGDNNGPGNDKHGEGSYRLAKSLDIPANPNTGGVPNGVRYTGFPNSHKKLKDSVDQDKIDRIGQDLFGDSGISDAPAKEDAPAGCCSGSAPATPAASAGEFVPDDQLPGKDNREKVWNYLISLGFTPIQAAGAMGNIAREGVFDPQSVEDGKGLVARSKNPDDAQDYGWGLIGFTPGHSVFTTWAKNAHLGSKVNYDNVYYISTQLNIIYNYMKNVTGDRGGNMWKEYVADAKDPASAARSWEAEVENAGVKAQADRDQYAKDAMKDFGSSSGTASSSATSTTGAACCPTSGADLGTGTLPDSVPKPYNAIFTAAAEKSKISPALLAAIFYGGEHGSSWPDPPPPYGHGSPWASSPYADGPFQFVPSTWAAYARDGNGDGKKEVQDLTDGAFGAAAYLYASGARGDKVSTFHDAIYSYNHAEWYVDQVMVAYNKFKGGGGSGASSASSATSATPASSSSGCSSGTGEIQQGSVAELSQKLLDYKKSGKYNCDNPGDCTDLDKMVKGDSLSGSDGCIAKALDKRVLQMLLYAIENGGFKVGTFAFCGDHGTDSPRGHSGGFAVDISSVNGASINQDTSAAKANGLKMDKFLNDLPKELQLSQQISWGYGEHHDNSFAATQQYDGKLCKSTCESIYTTSVEQGHMNHIHAGF